MTLRDHFRWLFVVSVIAAVASCSPKPGGIKPPTTGITGDNHTFFPITAGTAHALGRTVVPSDGPLSCESCHLATSSSFTEVTCTSCHTHDKSISDLLHSSVVEYGADAGFSSQSCLGCHPAGAKVPYDHANIAGSCATCHDISTPWARLPKAGFTHPEKGNSDCGACHVTTTWLDAGSAPSNVSDPANDITVNALIPFYAGTSISRLTPQVQSLSMPMNHATTEVTPAALTACANCHEGASSGSFFPGNLHSSLANHALASPATCSGCHAPSAPTGFVGPTATNPVRNPASGEMKHDAVAWLNGAPGTTRAVPFDCSVCHSAPTPALASSWGTGKTDAGPTLFHLPLKNANKPLVASCVDCHANSRPNSVLTSANGLPANLQFDHRVGDALGDCAGCHLKSATTWAAWSGGTVHAPGVPVPATCGSCHASERPTSLAGWVDPAFRNSPFDYVTNSSGITHGAGQDCAGCHTNTSNWSGGKFVHGPASLSATTCISCHLSQRPDLQAGTTPAAMATLLGFDHSVNGTGDCFGCHQATATANTYVNYNNPGTGALPNGDWKGGQPYPGSTLISSPTQFISIPQLTLNRSGANNLVTSTSSATATLYNAMLHISPAVPAALNAGPTNAPDNSKCWHCHTNTNGTVTAFANGKYHASLTNYRATPGGAVAPIAQPTTLCTSCHSQMRPNGIVEKAASILQPMDHSALFTAPVTINGQTVNGVGPLDCSTCHTSPGGVWSDGRLHARINTAVPTDCTVCHYPGMADAVSADVTLGTTFSMRHRSAQITFQNCKTCHLGALAKGASTPIASTLWQPGLLHPSVTAQPTTCLECHASSDPLPNASTQSSVIYAMPLGATATNKPQFMNHGSALVTGKDCVVCHAADAKKTGSAWNKATAFHPLSPNPATCKECHGLTNGGGAVSGTNNNLPLGLTNSTRVTTASASTGVPAGTLSQINHADSNVTSRDCKFCHTQAGASSVAGVQGKEWAVATFHLNFNAANPLVMNGTTGRCSSCHLNVKPGPGYTGQSHTAFTAASGSTDCSACHSFPGSGSAAAPNWLGAAGGVPTFIPVGGFTIPQPPATGASTQLGINNLPHPTVLAGVACTTCHALASGGKQAKGYDHKATALINPNCAACHEAGSNLVATPWNNAPTTASGAGDTRPFTLASVVPSFKGNSRAISYPKHFYPIGCYQCHREPGGTATTTTGAAFKTAWRFAHSTGAPMTNPATCNICHQNGGIPN